jgi:hypothetical protein
MSLYKTYLYVILLIKIATLLLFFKNFFNPSSVSEYYGSLSDKIFNILMALLMIYLFHPSYHHTKLVNRETKVFLFTFAIMTLIHMFFSLSG